jgi:hypothetical protein
MSNGDPEDRDFRDRPADPRAGSPEQEGPKGPIMLMGFWDGKGRLYRSKDLHSYVEIDPEEVQSFGEVDRNSVPFLGDQKTWVKLPADARVVFVRTGPVGPADDFVIEARFGGSVRGINEFVKPITHTFCSRKHWDPDWPWPTFPWPNRDQYVDK